MVPPHLHLRGERDKGAGMSAEEQFPGLAARAASEGAMVELDLWLKQTYPRDQELNVAIRAKNALVWQKRKLDEAIGLMKKASETLRNVGTYMEQVERERDNLALENERLRAGLNDA